MAMGLIFESKLEQATAMITQIADVFKSAPITVVTDSWFGNNGLFKPLRQQLGRRVNLLSRLRSNNNVFDLPCTQGKCPVGRPRKYGAKLGTATSLSAEFKSLASEYTVNLYGRERTVVAYERVVMLKSIRCAVKLVWVYRQSQWSPPFCLCRNLRTQRVPLKISFVIFTIGFLIVGFLAPHIYTHKYLKKRTRAGIFNPQFSGPDDEWPFVFTLRGLTSRLAI